MVTPPNATTHLSGLLHATVEFVPFMFLVFDVCCGPLGKAALVNEILISMGFSLVP